MKNDLLDPKWGSASPMHDPYALANFQVRPTDVLITTGPKCGTTWMQQILHQLRSGGDESFANIYDVVPWLEKPQLGKTWQQVLEEFERLPDPRIFKTHCTYEQTPGFGVVNVILTSRDPRDACVSFYHHMLNMTDEACARTGITRPESFAAYFEHWMGFGAWFRNIQSWWPHVGHPRLLWLRYEDMKADLGAAIDRVLGFLGWSLDTQQRQRVLQLSSFAWMKEHADKFITLDETRRPYFKPNSFIRKGIVGDHKAHLTPQQEERILTKAREMLEPDCLRFLDLG